MSRFVKITKWQADKVIEAAMKKEEARMQTAVVYVQGQVKASINRGNRDGKNPSAPGEPPKKVSARLFNSIFTQVARLKNEVLGIVGSNAAYARALELGTKNMKPRPYLRPALLNNITKVRAILGAKKK